MADQEAARELEQAALRIHRADPVDLVVATANPNVDFTAAWALHQKAKVPYMLLAGDDDVAKGAVSFRYRSGEQNNGVDVEDAVAEVVDAVARRIQV